MKIKNKLNKNIKIIISFALGMIVAGSGVYAATTPSSDVSYTNNSQSTVQGALDDIYLNYGNLKNNLIAYKLGMDNSPYKNTTDTSVQNTFAEECKSACSSQTPGSSGYTACMSSCVTTSMNNLFKVCSEPYQPGSDELWYCTCGLQFKELSSYNCKKTIFGS